MSLADVKMAERNILRGTRGNLNEVAAALVPEGHSWDAAESGLQWGAGSLLVMVPPAPWGHSHLPKQFGDQGIMGKAAQDIPLRLDVLE